MSEPLWYARSSERPDRRVRLDSLGQGVEPACRSDICGHAERHLGIEEGYIGKPVVVTKARFDSILGGDEHCVFCDLGSCPRHGRDCDPRQSTVRDRSFFAPVFVDCAGERRESGDRFGGVHRAATADAEDDLHAPGPGALYAALDDLESGFARHGVVDIDIDAGGVERVKCAIEAARGAQRGGAAGQQRDLTIPRSQRTQAGETSIAGHDPGR